MAKVEWSTQKSKEWVVVERLRPISEDRPKRLRAPSLPSASSPPSTYLEDEEIEVTLAPDESNDEDEDGRGKKEKKKRGKTAARSKTVEPPRISHILLAGGDVSFAATDKHAAKTSGSRKKGAYNFYT